MSILLDIKLNVGLSDLPFGETMVNAERLFGKSDDVELMDDIEDCKATLWHYWDHGFTLFFDEHNRQLFNCVEIRNADALLWGAKVFALNEKQIIELFKSKQMLSFDSEQHDWGEKRLSYDEANIDFYFTNNKLISLNYSKPLNDLPILILPN